MDLGVTFLNVTLSFSKFLQMKLTARHFTPQDIVEFTGIDRQTVWRHRKGTTEPSAVDRERYAKAFGMTLHDFDAEWLSAQAKIHVSSQVYDALTQEELTDILAAPSFEIFASIIQEMAERKAEQREAGEEAEEKSGKSRKRKK